MPNIMHCCHRLAALVLCALLVLLPVVAAGQEAKQHQAGHGDQGINAASDGKAAPNKKEDAAPATTPEARIALLNNLLAQKKNLQDNIAALKKSIASSPPYAETAELTAQLNNLNQQLNDTDNDFERIATGVNPIALQPAEQKKEAFDWKTELTALVEPIIRELRTLTAATKQKADLRAAIMRLEKQIQVTQQAIANLKELRKAGGDRALVRELDQLRNSWQNEQNRLQSKLDLSRLDLHQLKAASGRGAMLGRVAERLKDFFKTRGLYLLSAILAFACTFFLLRLLLKLALHQLLAHQADSPRRQMYARLVAVFSHFVSLLCAIAAMLTVFFLVADWFMISLVLLICLGVLWGLRQTLPKQWERSLFLLNLGPAREGERLTLNGIPWRIDKLGMFCWLSNPALDEVQRLPIELLLKQVSRPYNLDEPWFPCRKGDYLRLADGSVAQVTHLSSEQVVLANLGTGMTSSCSTAAFLGMGISNMSRKFLVSVTLGLSYDLQAEITRQIPGTLRSFLQSKLEQEGYTEKCTNLSCEFGSAGSSSLDLSISLEFTGEMAALYYRLRRAIWRWCVECCTENNWEIPFDQLVVHGAPAAEPGPVLLHEAA